MADIELVIKIPEELYKDIKEHGLCGHSSDREIVSEAIANGKPLPKGHGRLIDADELLKYNCIDVWTDHGLETKISGLSVDTAPTIIEADKGE